MVETDLGRVVKGVHDQLPRIHHLPPPSPVSSLSPSAVSPGHSLSTGIMIMMTAQEGHVDWEGQVQVESGNGRAQPRGAHRQAAPRRRPPRAQTASLTCDPGPSSGPPRPALPRPRSLKSLVRPANQPEACLRGRSGPVRGSESAQRRRRKKRKETGMAVFQPL